MNDDELHERLGSSARRANPLSAEEILARAVDRDREEATLRRVSVGVATAFAVLMLGLWVLPRVGSPDLAFKGLPGVGSARLTWVVEDGAAVRAGDAVVPAGARVVFAVEGSARGFACVDEESPDGWTRVLPPSGKAWPVRPGRSLFEAGGSPQAFTTDHGSGPRTYRLRVHPDDASCHGAADLGQWSLRWLAP